ncbi:DUF7507 domain-containing protein [Actinokineospora cianjurensis]|uniref:LPXTG-motif cell wall-anchored protein/uncharacterized repeat protein (TIGR01451 family)/fimbrial isopeptide formation D2 family protein n=1 Tax=Actinokineospora cianjurensis TaxID=585224 RepID=A0A421AWX7_9PSEU|nr:LPXTG cell wall anchor domain-containing protein [Actinokineospora cianjurensis]RLK54319.1 LPXTG-motif cell wall-anchored protein/uncharacterized repeat protein (TIGR01451 family)/fimbrial isopeptide formation D2 family protein [Actinokineospora cianjurensis]
MRRTTSVLGVLFLVLAVVGAGPVAPVAVAGAAPTPFTRLAKFSGPLGLAEIGGSELAETLGQNNCGRPPTTAALALPTGSVLRGAFLRWSGTTENSSVATMRPANPIGSSISFTVPGAAPVTVTSAADSSDHVVLPGTTLRFQGRFADVTSVLAGLPALNGGYSADVTGGYPNGCPLFQGNARAWTLTVVYENPAITELSTAYIYHGMNTLAGGSQVSIGVTGFRSPVVGSTAARLTFVAIQGDPALAGETLRTDQPGLAAAPPDWADSSSGVALDIDTLTGDLSPGATSLRIDAGTTGDVITLTEVNLLVRTEPAGVSVSKTADIADPVGGDTVTYTVRYTNTGGVDLAGQTFTDDLSQVLDDGTYVPGDATTGSATLAGTTLTWTGDVAFGQTVTVTYGVRLDKRGDARLINTVTANGPQSNCTTGSTDTRCRVALLVRSSEFVKTADNNDPEPGETVTYTVRVTNTGAVDLTGLSFADDLSGVVDDATYNGATASSGVVSYTGTRLAWSGDLVVGAVATVTYSITLHDPATGDNQMVNTIVSTGPGSTCGEGSTNPACTVALPLPGLHLAKSANVTGSATPGQGITYTVDVTNTGQVDLPNQTAIDDLAKVLDDATYMGDAAATVGTVRRVENKLVWVGDLAIGQTARVTYSVHVTGAGDARLANTVTSPGPGSNCKSGTTSSECTVSHTMPRVSVSKTAQYGDTLPTLGGKVTFVLVMRNQGTEDVVGQSMTDDLSSVLDDAVYNNDATATIGTASYTAPVLRWDGALRIDEVATVTFSVTIRDHDLGDGQLHNTVHSTGPNSGCAPSSSGRACSVSVGVEAARAKKEVTPTRRIEPGGTATYTITLLNEGGPTDPVLVDDLAAVLDDAAYNNDAKASVGTVVLDGTKLTWTGSLDIDKSAVITYSVRVNDPPSGDGTLGNSIVVPGSNCLASSADPLCHTSVATTPRATPPPSTQPPRGQGSAQGGLPNTGFPVGTVLLAGLGLILLGAAAVVRTRRRH